MAEWMCGGRQLGWETGRLPYVPQVLRVYPHRVNQGEVALVCPSEIESRGTALRLYSVVEQWFRECASPPKHCLGAAKTSS